MDATVPQPGGANLPNQDSLNALYGSWNPMAYSQGYQNQDTANAFRDQAYQQQQNTTQQGTLADQFNAANNPQLLAKQGLDNQLTAADITGKNINNASSGIDLASKSDLYPDKQSLLHQQIASNLSDEQLKIAGNHAAEAYAEALNAPDASTPQGQARIQQADVYRQAIAGGAAESAKRAQERQLAELQRTTQANIASGQQQTERDVANIHGQTSRDTTNAIVGGRATVAGINKAVDLRMAQAMDKLQTNPDDPNAQREFAQALAARNAAYGGKLDLTGMGFPNVAQSAAGGGQPATSGGASSSVSPPKGQDGKPMKQIGTSGGVPVYQDSDGKQYIGQNSK